MRSIVSLLLLLAVGCGDVTPSKESLREQELSYLREVMPASLLPHANLEVGALEAVALGGESSDRHLQFLLSPKHPKVNKGSRAELSVDFPFLAGDEIAYAWSFYIPEDFVSDAPQNRWWLVAQWHDQPDQTAGESWEDFPSHSPSVAISIGELAEGLALGLHYGTETIIDCGHIPIQRSRWYSLRMVIHWSQTSTGNASLFIDDMTVPALSVSGINMHNRYQHYFKLGMYRHPDIQTENKLYLKAINIAKQSGE